MTELFNNRLFIFQGLPLWKTGKLEIFHKARRNNCDERRECI